MKRILVLNYEFPPLGGGASPVSYEVAKRLSETGDFDIDVVTMGYKGLPKYEEVNSNFRIHRVPCWRSKKEICHPWEQATYLVTGYTKACELIRKQAYDICHCHFIIPTGVIAFLLNQRFALPYILTSHGSDVLGYNRRFKKIYPLLISRWKSILNHARSVVTPSIFLKMKIVEVYPQFNKDKIQVVPNGFDICKFSNKQKNNWIFSSGRLFSNKGFQYLIEAVSLENIGYEVHIAGDGPMMSELKSSAAKSKTKIIFHGWLNNESAEYRELVERSAIYALISDEESFGMSIIEAMSAGAAIITTNSSGSAELVGEAGILVPPRSTDTLRTELLELVSNPSVLRTFQMEAFNRSKMFDWKIIMEAYINVLSGSVINSDLRNKI